MKNSIPTEKEKNELKKYQEERDKFVNSVIDSLDKGVIPWEKNWETTEGVLHNPVSKVNYKGNNLIRLAVASHQKGYVDPRWCTFEQAKKEKWSVKKGEKGTTIEFYTRWDKDKKEVFQDKTVENMSFEERVKYMRKNVYGVIKTYTVFNAEQIDGIPQLKAEKREVDYNKIDKILENSKVAIVYGGNEAVYNRLEDKIHLPSKEAFKSENRFYGTALHELSHSTGHEERLNRDMSGHFGTKKYAREELVAEFSSVFIGQELGLNYSSKELENSKAYLQNWANALKEDKNLLYGAIKDAEIASATIIKMQEKNAPEIFQEINQKRSFSQEKNQESKKGIER